PLGGGGAPPRLAARACAGATEQRGDASQPLVPGVRSNRACLSWVIDGWNVSLRVAGLENLAWPPRIPRRANSWDGPARRLQRPHAGGSGAAADPRTQLPASHEDHDARHVGGDRNRDRRALAGP